ncbi:MAG TPA: metalloregulator ArsR/SmtB family transcription factor [Pseudogracilibacillus sp.]|nr:metalloregulator ArsR/SmtB family transcription factor [Pseudogracilibacillus sp.]
MAEEIDKTKIDMLDPSVERDVANLFKAFSNTTRIKILFALKKQPLTVSQISDVVSMSQSAVSHQLKELKMARLVTNERRGREMIYELDDDHVHQIFDMAIEHVLEIYHYE